MKRIPAWRCYIGRRHWTREVLNRLHSEHCAEEMRALLAKPDYAEAHIEEGPLLLVGDDPQSPHTRYATFQTEALAAGYLYSHVIWATAVNGTGPLT